MDVILFLVFALFAVACAINVVVQTHPIAGAIMVLFVFVIMLLNAGAESKSGRSLVAQALGVPSLVALLGILAFFVQRLFPRESATHFGGFTGGTAKAVGKALFTTYLLPFEATSILILIAIVGAIVLAYKEMD
jgi:NADH-quinone oxidoreductase subunit J